MLEEDLPLVSVTAIYPNSDVVVVIHAKRETFLSLLDTSSQEGFCILGFVSLCGLVAAFLLPWIYRALPLQLMRLASKRE
jgi:hypothetical protein